jgi:hypothetical protein
MPRVALREGGGDPYHPLARIVRNRRQCGSALQHHRAQQRLGIGQADTGASVGKPFDRDIARQQQADRRIGRNRAERERRIARAENHVVTKLPAELLPECGAQVDLGQDAEPLLLERLAHARHCIAKGQRQFDVESQFLRHVSVLCKSGSVGRRRPLHRIGAQTDGART